MKIFILKFLLITGLSAQAQVNESNQNTPAKKSSIELKPKVLIDKDGDNVIILDQEFRANLDNIKDYNPTNVFDEAKAVVEEKKTVRKSKPKLGEYIVKEGDNFKKISELIYGNEKKWKEIYLLNEAKITDPQLKAGQRIKYYLPENELKNNKEMQNEPK